MTAISIHLNEVKLVVSRLTFSSAISFFRSNRDDLVIASLKSIDVKYSLILKDSDNL